MPGYLNCNSNVHVCITSCLVYMLYQKQHEVPIKFTSDHLWACVCLFAQPAQKTSGPLWLAYPGPNRYGPNDTNTLPFSMRVCVRDCVYSRLLLRIRTHLPSKSHWSDVTYVRAYRFAYGRTSAYWHIGPVWTDRSARCRLSSLAMHSVWFPLWPQGRTTTERPLF